MPKKITSEKETGTNDKRTRNWTFIIYPDSAPGEWRKLINSLNFPWIESPLHEGETNPDNETEKKAHYHVLLLFDGKKSYGQVSGITEHLNATIPQICHNSKGLVRYMAHMDNPEKKQYSKSDIIGHNGADPSLYLKASGSARYELIGEMRVWIDNNQCNEFYQLFDYACSERFDDWFPLLCDNSAYILGEYIKSKRHHAAYSTQKYKPNAFIDRDTGEIVVFPPKNKKTGSEKPNA
jgi:hypothetical protein